MKAISLMQPWATLIAIGAKRIETRSWPTRYRGPLAIHASKNIPTWAREELAREPAFGDALRAAGLSGTTVDLPLGAIVAVARLVGVVPITRQHGLVDPNVYEVLDGTGQPRRWEVTRQELIFGGYSDGRFAWLLDDVRAIGPVTGVKGSLGLWDCESRFLPKGL